MVKSLDEFLDEQGIREEVTDMALERVKVMQLVEALREIRAVTWRRSLPITDEINQIATDALRFKPSSGV